MHLRVFIQTYPNVFHISIASVSSLFGLTMMPSLIPLTFTLAALLLYAPILFHRRQYRYAALLWLSISLCSSLGRLFPTLNALSTAGTSVAVLLAASLVSSALAFLAIFIDVLICTRIRVNQAALFPAIWTTLWAASSHMPLGRLPSWSPVSGTQSYSWMAPWVGPAGIDWVVAAWAVVISQSIGNWYMGSSEEDIDMARTKFSNTVSTSSGTWVLAIFLTALTIPPFILSGFPLPVSPVRSVTQLSVGCALPPFWKHHHTTPTLDDYIEESKKLPAKLILWPEGAVSFPSASERDAGLADIAVNISADHTYWAVSFEEETSDPSDDSGRTGRRRTGVALLSNTSDPQIYYKRNLVPSEFQFDPF